VEYLELPAPPPLDAIVRCFWFLRGEANGAAAETVVPDGRVDVVVHLGEPFARLDERGVPVRDADVLLGGQLAGPLRLVQRGPADVIGIRFRTAGAHAVLDLPLGQFTGQVGPLARLRPALAAALVDAAASAHEPRARVAALATALGRFVRHQPAPLIAAAVRALGSATHPPRVRHIAQRLGVSARTLERRVLAEVGLNPALLHRVLRFRRGFALLDRNPPGTWACAATAAGYYDQAHLIRDFRAFAGAPPSAFFRGGAWLARAFLGGGEAA